MIPDARLAIVVLGTVLVHVAIGIGLDSIDSPPRKRRAPTIELEPPPLPQVIDPVPPEPEPTPEPEPEPAPAPEPEKVVRETPRASRATPRSETAPPPSDTPPPIDPGGSGTPVYRMEGLAPGATGVPVESGPPRKGRTGRGGRGGGSGSGTGTGSGDGVGSGSAAAPVSVASIKTRAKAKGDFAYFDARKEYPEEARRLSIEGQIKVRLLVDARGKVTSAKLLTKLGHGLDELAMKRARVIEFEPALDTDDRPVASVVVWTFTFEIPK